MIRPFSAALGKNGLTVVFRGCASVLEFLGMKVINYVLPYMVMYMLLMYA